MKTDLFDNRKVKHIRRLDRGNEIVLLWIGLLALAGKCDNGGTIEVAEGIPFSVEDLSDELRFSPDFIAYALGALEEHNLIVRDGEYIFISGWEEHQSLDKKERIREQTRKRVAKHRKNKKLYYGNGCEKQECNAVESEESAEDNELSKDVTGCNALHVTRSNAGEKEKEKEKEIKESKDSLLETDVQAVVSAWNQTSFVGVSRMNPNSKRYKMLKARLSEFGLQGVLQAIKNAEESEFLRSEKAVGWFDFEWLVRPNNFPKVFEGKYNSKTSSVSTQQGNQWET